MKLLSKPLSLPNKQKYNKPISKHRHYLQHQYSQINDKIIIRTNGNKLLMVRPRHIIHIKKIFFESFIEEIRATDIWESAFIEDDALS